MTRCLRSWMVLAVVAALALPAGATTLRRAGLEELVGATDTVVVGEVVETASYWNADGSFILTDVKVAPREVLKGEAGSGLLTVTLQGGTVGDTTVLIVGGPDLRPGRSYVLFVDRGSLPGARDVRTVGDLSQGAFDVVDGPGGARAVSQAAGLPLVPDAAGRTEVPGGAAGMSLDELKRSVREMVQRPVEESHDVPSSGERGVER